MGIGTTSGSNIVYRSGVSTTTYPLTMGCWARVFNNADVAGIGIANSGSTGTNYRFLYAYHFGSDLQCVLEAGSSSVATVSGVIAPVAGEWVYLLGRFITATNKRIQVYCPRTGISSANTTSSDSLTGFDTTISFGCYSPQGTGEVAEVFFANADPQVDGAAIQPALMYKLAFEGPFSLPGFAKNVTEYHSHREGFPTGKTADDYYGQGITGAPFTASTSLADAKKTSHPSLYPGYIRPNEPITELGIV